MRSDPLEAEWIDALSKLQDQVPPLSFATVRPLIDEAIGGSIESYFSRFNVEAIAAGSIAQVHAATLSMDRTSSSRCAVPGSSGLSMPTSGSYGVWPGSRSGASPKLRD